jgi:DNA-binding transcriptional regulator YhcF (GntR family)
MRIAAINPVELLTWWEGRGGRRPLTLRALASKLGVAESTVRNRLQSLRAAGQVDDTARAQALAERGRHRRGIRTGAPIDDTALAAAWAKTPNVTAVARRLHVSRTRVRRRLQTLGLYREPLIPPSEEDQSMSTRTTIEPVFDTRAAAPLLGVRPSTLEKWRCQGKGPRFIKSGFLVIYRLRDINDYLNTQSRKSTADPG